METGITETGTTETGITETVTIIIVIIVTDIIVTGTTPASIKSSGQRNFFGYAGKFGCLLWEKSSKQFVSIHLF